ncbi:hypothetical protein HOP50_09g55750 [Chloropicon primus]|uniref:Uncharacterized protein n=1 Tax=Chloropicon primus TaxID=1764295 RepID=A0A5B8MRJ6_9CHLO|nr:hypothetical protein A3770_09p55490 [Chloropicon primus]UPR02249.1 hypothetical protein HOP50_09g55750 [Chloropicon primus]|eukprot:QDZ23031.1 hypothetical protein A3770_09p55490 [Chloropicon primus]
MAGGGDSDPSSGGRSYKNPLKHARTRGFLTSIEEVSPEGSPHKGQDEAAQGSARNQDDGSNSLRRVDALSKSATDPFNQPIGRGDAAYSSNETPCYNYSLREYLDKITSKFEDAGGRQSMFRKLRRQRTRFLERNDSNRWSNTSSESGALHRSCGSDGAGSLRSRGHECLILTNRILSFVLMALAIVLIFGVLISMAVLTPQAKTVLVRTGRMFGEQAIVFSNVTIEDTTMDGLTLKNLPNIGDVVGSMFGMDPVTSMSKSAESPEWRWPWEDPPPSEAEEIELKDAKEAKKSEELEVLSVLEEPKDAFLEWCEAAPCAKALRDKCPQIKIGLEKGSNGPVPVLPFPKEFCAAFRQLNRSRCLCDKNIQSIPDGERLFQTRSLISSMCGFRDELKKCGGAGPGTSG